MKTRKSVAIFAVCLILFIAVGQGARADSFGAEWVAALRKEALAAGVSAAMFDRIFKTLTPDCKQPGVTCHDRPAGAEKKPVMPPHLRGLPESCNRVTQLEFVHPARYFPERTLNGLASRGRSIIAKWRKEKPAAYEALVRVTRETGVSLPILVALWGRETGYGAAKLRHNAIRALASLARFGTPSRAEWARGQLIAALKIVDEGHVSLANLDSSYAGAIGLTQLTPDEFLTFALDADNDGRKDIWRSEVDALASTANVLKHRGWRGDLKTWGYEIELPDAENSPFDCTLEGRFTRKSFHEWTGIYGLRRARRGKDGNRLPFPKLDQEGYVVAPAGTRGPVFLVTENFDVLRAYNMSDNYSIFVGHVADRISCPDGGKCGFAASWPSTEEGGFEFTVPNLCRLQMALKERGFYPFEPDGLFGGQTRVAIGKYQKSLGQKPTCYPNRELFKTLTAADASG